MHPVYFQFQDISLQEACWISGKPYFTRRAIGEWLEYPQPNQAIEKIIRRNPHIEDSKWSSTVPKLGTVEGSREVFRNVRVYDPIGLQLIVFESRKPRAIAYKIAVANLVWAYMNGTLKPSKWAKGDLLAASRQIYSLPWSHARGALVRDLAESQGCSLATIRRATGQRLLTTKGLPIRRRSPAQLKNKETV